MGGLAGSSHDLHGLVGRVTAPNKLATERVNDSSLSLLQQ